MKDSPPGVRAAKGVIAVPTVSISVGNEALPTLRPPSLRVVARRKAQTYGVRIYRQMRRAPLARCRQSFDIDLTVVNHAPGQGILVDPGGEPRRRPGDMSAKHVPQGTAPRPAVTTPREAPLKGRGDTEATEVLHRG